MPVPEEGKSSKKTNILIFAVVVFIFTVIAVVFCANILSPDVDVEIGGKGENVQDSNSNTKIDNRLRLIQMEDNLPGASKLIDESMTPEEKEKAEKIEKFKASDKKQDDEEVQEEQQIEHKKITTPPMPTVNKVAKIFIGKYSTIDQAISMQNRIIESGLSVSPFIKDLGGYYTIQIGSFINIDGAKNIQKELIDQGFAARIEYD